MDRAETPCIVADLAKAKAHFQRPRQSGINTFFKNAQNPKGMPYSTAADIDEATSASLIAHGFAPITIHPWQKDGHWFAGGILRHVSGDDIRADVPLYMTKHDMQSFKSALTYAHRMLLICLTGALGGCEDDDANTAAQPASTPAKNPRAVLESAAAENDLRKALADRNADLSRASLAKLRLYARRGEIDADLLARAERAYERAFAEEAANV
jgi:hypothetical protein